MPLMLVDGLANLSNQADLPTFNPDALQSLTSQIQRDLQKSKKPASKVPPTGNGRGQEGKKDKNKNKKQDDIEVKKPNGARSSGTIVKSNRKSFPDAGQKRGIKRLRNGELKATQPAQFNTKSDKGSSKRQFKGRDQRGKQSVDLRDEIRALGGSEEDYELVVNAGSESEYEGPHDKITEGKLLKDVKNFVGGLGITAVQEDDASTESSDHGGEAHSDARDDEFHVGDASKIRSKLEGQAKGHTRDKDAKPTSKSRGKTVRRVFEALYPYTVANGLVASTTSLRMARS